MVVGPITPKQQYEARKRLNLEANARMKNMQTAAREREEMAEKCFALLIKTVSDILEGKAYIQVSHDSDATRIGVVPSDQG